MVWRQFGGERENTMCPEQRVRRYVEMLAFEEIVPIPECSRQCSRRTKKWQNVFFRLRNNIEIDILSDHANVPLFGQMLSIKMPYRTRFPLSQRLGQIR